MSKILAGKPLVALRLAEEQACAGYVIGSGEIRPCVGTAFDLWFGPNDDPEPQLRETPRERRFREYIAKTICAECPFVAECLADELAFGIGEQWGVRGGKTAPERQDLIRNRDAAADRDVVAVQAVA